MQLLQGIGNGETANYRKQQSHQHEKHSWRFEQQIRLKQLGKHRKHGREKQQDEWVSADEKGDFCYTFGQIGIQPKQERDNEIHDKHTPYGMPLKRIWHTSGN